MWHSWIGAGNPVATPQRILRHIFFISIVLLMFPGCNKDREVIINSYTDYFPLRNGSYLVWWVDSIRHNSFTGTIDTFHFWIKDVVREPYSDNEGRPGIIVDRYIKYADTSQWQVFKVYYYITASTYLMMNYDNVSLVKMVSPVEQGKTWNLNEFNSRNAATAGYEKVGGDTTLGNTTYRDIVVVREKNKVNAIQKSIARTLYARNIGPIYIEEIEMEMVYVGGSYFWDGYEKYMRLVEYSH